MIILSLMVGPSPNQKNALRGMIRVPLLVRFTSIPPLLADRAALVSDSADLLWSGQALKAHAVVHAHINLHNKHSNIQDL